MDNRLTCSQIRSLRRCHFKHYLEYVLGIRPANQANYFRYGGVFHNALDFRANGRTIEQAIYNALLPYDDMMASDEVFIEKSILGSLLKAYFWRWQDMDNSMKIIASELPFNLPLINPHTGQEQGFSVAGKIDKIVQLEDGRLAVMEHKTTSDDLDPTSNYWKRLRIDLQISIYTLAAQSLGYPVEAVLYDVVRKPVTKPKQLTQGQTKHLLETGNYLAKLNGHELTIGSYSVDSQKEPLTVVVGDEFAEVTEGVKAISITETFNMFGDRVFADMCDRYDYFFARREIPRLESDINQTRLSLWQYAQMLTRCEKDNCWPMNDDGCVGFGTCSYFDLCTGGFDPFTDNYIPEGFVVVPDVHQELLN
ncbi:MAG: PD-(D/E)XK nuclease family protein [Sedimentisphaerales bacterium]|nr:PD-(D/E)XK nuclease family protein [Sedimentisphaerales bacterium]